MVCCGARQRAVLVCAMSCADVCGVLFWCVRCAVRVCAVCLGLVCAVCCAGMCGLLGLVCAVCYAGVCGVACWAVLSAC